MCEESGAITWAVILDKSIPTTASRGRYRLVSRWRVLIGGARRWRSQPCSQKPRYKKSTRETNLEKHEKCGDGSWGRPCGGGRASAEAAPPDLPWAVWNSGLRGTAGPSSPPPRFLFFCVYFGPNQGCLFFLWNFMSLCSCCRHIMFRNSFSFQTNGSHFHWARVNRPPCCPH